MSSPPLTLGAGTEQYTQDVAVIAIDDSKIDPSSFAGNVIDLGTKLSRAVLDSMMYPNPKNRHNFEYPANRLLSLRGIIADDKLRKPTMYNKAEERCANNSFSYTRRNDFGYEDRISEEWAILPFDHKSGPFSAQGDSGSIVVDGEGRIGGILTGIWGVADSLDVSYATPANFILKANRGCKEFAKAYPRACSASSNFSDKLLLFFLAASRIPSYSRILDVDNAAGE